MSKIAERTRLLSSRQNHESSHCILGLRSIKLKYEKKMKTIFSNLKFFCENHHPKRHIKYKVVDFTLINKSIMANKVPITNLERFLRRL